MTKDIQKAVCKMQVLMYHTVCENIDPLYRWEMDVMSISRSGSLYEFEVKISRSDFKADFKKGKMEVYFGLQRSEKWCPNYFSYVCPEYLIALNDIPSAAGLYYFKEGEITCIRKARKLHNVKHDKQSIIERAYRMYCERNYLGACRKTYEDKASKERREAFQQQLQNNL